MSWIQLGFNVLAGSINTCQPSRQGEDDAVHARLQRSLRIEVRGERITGDAGAVTGREVLRRSGVVRWMAKRIRDARDGRRIRHTMTELLRTALLLAAQCRRDHNDAGALRGETPPSASG